MRNLRLSVSCVGFLGSCLLLLCLFSSLTQAKRSACWRYGHSCWGGHGKRSDSGIQGGDVRGGLGLGRVLPLQVVSQILRRQGEPLSYKVLRPPPLFSHLLHKVKRAQEQEENGGDGESQSQQDVSSVGKFHSRETSLEKSNSGEKESTFSEMADKSIFVRDRKRLKQISSSASLEQPQRRSNKLTHVG